MAVGSQEPGPIIVFDTDCVLCSGLVALILAHERDKALRFAGAWSDEGGVLAERHGFSRADLDETFLLIDGDMALARSDAALAIACYLAAPWSWLTALRIVPRPLRDFTYGVVARHRYRWFGRRTACARVPPTNVIDSWACRAHKFVSVGPLQCQKVERGRSRNGSA